MAAGDRQQNALGRDAGRGGDEFSGRDVTSSRTRGLVLPVVLGIASALGLLLSYLEIGPTSFRIAIFSCIIAGFVAALFQRRSLAQAHEVVAEERQARLATARELRDELASLRNAVQGGSAADVGPLHAELAALAGKVSALEQSQSAFRDSLVQEMNPGRGRRRGRAGDATTSGDVPASAAANGSTTSPYPASYETAPYPSPSYEPRSYEPAYASSPRRSWSGADAAPPSAPDDANTAPYGSTDYADYDTANQPVTGADNANQRLAEIFPAPERGHDAGTGRPSWGAGSANGTENGSGNGANGNPYNDAFAYADDGGTAMETTSTARSALWESSAASRLASTGAGTSPAPRTPWQPEPGEHPTPGGRAPWSQTSQLGDDEDPVAAAVRHGSPRRGRPSDEDPHDMTQTQRLSASEQTAIRRRFLDLSSMDDDAWSRRR